VKYKYIVDSGFSGAVNSYLRVRHNYSSRVATSVRKGGRLFLNGKKARFIDKCCPGDTILVYMPDEEPNCSASDGLVSVVYEDDDVIVLDKAAGMIVHPTKSHQGDTLANAIQGHWLETGHVGAIRFVNRIDRDTSGIVVGAKNKYVHHFIQSQFDLPGTTKKYLAVAKGRPPQKTGRIDAPIGMEAGSPRREVQEGAKESVTEYSTIEELGGYTLLELELLSGRTHQIRVHLAHIGCPVAGDDFYGDGIHPPFARLALHAWQIGFVHPRTKEHVVYTCPLAADLQEAIETLRAGKG